MSHAHPPVFSASPVLINISEPEKRLINGSGLLVYSVNRFHFDSLLYTIQASDAEHQAPGSISLATDPHGLTLTFVLVDADQDKTVSPTG